MPRPRVRLAAVGVTAVAALGVLSASGLNESLVYYRTPSEVSAAEAVQEQRLRVGGLVQEGSVVSAGEEVRFILTDGVGEVRVVHTGDPPGVFQEGQGALVEGSFDDAGVFRSDLLIVKHSNEYVAEDGQAYQPPASPGEAAR